MRQCFSKEFVLIFICKDFLNEILRLRQLDFMICIFHLCLETLFRLVLWNLPNYTIRQFLDRLRLDEDEVAIKATFMVQQFGGMEGMTLDHRNDVVPLVNDHILLQHS